MKETDIGRPVVRWLRDMGWDVYQEVQPYNAEIIAVLGRFAWTIECKVRMNYKVIDQAWEQSRIGQWSSVAVPKSSWDCYKEMHSILLRHYGLGCITVDHNGAVQEAFKSRFNRQKTRKTLWKFLCEKQKTYCDAGSPGGYAWSEYRATCERLVNHVKKHPGITLKDALKEIDHHYSSMASAKRSLAHWLKLGKVAGVRAETVNRGLCLFPSPNPTVNNDIL